MLTTAPHNEQGTTPERVLFMAFELSEKTWKLGFTTGPGQKPRERGVAARNQARVLQEVAQAKQRFGLPESAPVVSCYEAGREGFWLHRFLQAQGITNHVVDSSSIEVNRRKRRAKSDGLDVRKLLSMLLRFHQGEREVWRVVHVPSVEAEDQRHLHRDLESLKQERASTTARIKGLRSSQGLRLTTLNKLPEQLDALRLWDGAPLPSGLRPRLLRVYAHHQFLSEQIAALEAEDQRHLHRDLESLKQERASTTARIKGLLSSQGLRLTTLNKLPEQLDALRLWDGASIPSGLRHRLLRVYAHHQFLSEQIAAVEAERRALLETAHETSLEKIRQLMQLKGIGINGAWLLVMEFFGWRDFKNRREVGGLAGVTPTPYQSGEGAREQGITKSGNRHVRWMTTELAWSWLRYQPESALSCWFRERFGSGGKRLRRIGIVAVARKLLIALWRFLKSGVLPAGAVLKEA